MTLFDGINASPDPVRYWVFWMACVLTVVPLALLIRPDTRKTAIILILMGAVTAVVMTALHAKVGFVRLLGLPHVILWTPLLIWLVSLLRRDAHPGWPRLLLIVLAATIAVSLVFDYIDVARYLLGERAPMV